MPSLTRARLRAAFSFTLVLALVLAAAISGCGSSDNGVASKSATQILAAAKFAAEGASSVHVEGQFAQGPIASALDVDAASSHGARGRISLGKLAFEVVIIGDTVYVKGSRGFYGNLVGAVASRIPSGTWLKLSGTQPQLAGLVTQDKLLGRLLASPGTLTKGSTSAVNGQKVVELKQTGARVFTVTKLFTGSLYVATTGRPYPIQIVKRGLEHGTMTFSRWNEPVSLSAPAKAVDVNQLKRARH